MSSITTAGFTAISLKPRLSLKPTDVARILSSSFSRDACPLKMHAPVPTVNDVLDCATLAVAASSIPSITNEIFSGVIRLPLPATHSKALHPHTSNQAVCINSLDSTADVLALLRWLRDTSSAAFPKQSPVIALFARCDESAERLRTALRQATVLLNWSPNELPIPRAFNPLTTREAMARGAIHWLPANQILSNCAAYQSWLLPKEMSSEAADPVTVGDVVAFHYELMVPRCGPQELRLQPSARVFGLASPEADQPLKVPSAAQVAASAGVYLVVDVLWTTREPASFVLLPLSADAPWEPALDRPWAVRQKAHRKTSRILNSNVLNAMGLPLSLRDAAEVYRVGRLCHPQRLGEPAAADGGAAAMAAWAALLAEETAPVPATAAVSSSAANDSEAPLLGGLAADLSLVMRLYDRVETSPDESDNDGRTPRVEEGCLRCFGGGDAGRIIAPFDFLHIVQHRDACTTCGHPHSVARGVAVPIAPTDWKSGLASSRYASWRYCASEFTPAQHTLDIFALPKSTLYVRQVPSHHVAYPGYQIVAMEPISRAPVAESFTLPYVGRCLNDENIDFFESSYAPCGRCSAVVTEKLDSSTIYSSLFKDPAETEKLDREVSSMYVFGVPWDCHIGGPCVYGGQLYSKHEIRKGFSRLNNLDYRIDGSSVGWISALMNDPRGRSKSDVTSTPSLAVRNGAQTDPESTYIELTLKQPTGQHEEVTFMYGWSKSVWKNNIALFRNLTIEHHNSCHGMNAGQSMSAWCAPSRCFTTTMLQTSELWSRAAFRSTECLASGAQRVQICGLSPPRLSAKCFIASGEDILRVGGDVIPSLPDSLPPACVCPWGGKVPYDKSTLSCEHVGVLPCPCPKFVAVLCQPDDASCAWVLRPNGSPFARAICVAGVDACSCGKCSVRTTTAHPAFFAPNGQASTLKWPSAGYNAIIELRHEPKTGLAYCVVVAVSDIHPSEVIVVRAPKIDAVYRSQTCSLSDLPSLGFGRVPIPVALDAERTLMRRIVIDKEFVKRVTSLAAPFSNYCECPVARFLEGINPLKPWGGTINGTLVGPRSEFPALIQPQCPPMWVYSRVGRKLLSFVKLYSHILGTPSEELAAYSIPLQFVFPVEDTQASSTPLMVTSEPLHCPTKIIQEDYTLRLVVSSMKSVLPGSDGTLNSFSAFDGVVLVCGASELAGKNGISAVSMQSLERFLIPDRSFRAAVLVTNQQPVHHTAKKNLSTWCSAKTLPVLSNLGTFPDSMTHPETLEHATVRCTGLFAMKSSAAGLPRAPIFCKRRAFERCNDCPRDCDEYDEKTAIHQKCYGHTAVFVGLSVGNSESGSDWFLVPVPTAQVLLGDRFKPSLLSFYADLQDLRHQWNHSDKVLDLRRQCQLITFRAVELLEEAHRRFLEVIDISSAESEVAEESSLSNDSLPSGEEATPSPPKQHIPAKSQAKRRRKATASSSEVTAKAPERAVTPPRPAVVFKKVHRFLFRMETAQF